MNKEQYQSAFSWVEPSEAALEKAMAHAKLYRKRPRVSTVLLAAALSVLLLTGGVFAATRWFTIRGAEELQTAPRKEIDGPVQAEPQAPARQLLELSHPDVQSYVGFTLPEAYHSMADMANCLDLSALMEHDQMRSALPAGTSLDGVFSRYFGVDSEGKLLTVEVQGSPTLSRDCYFTRGSFTVEKEEVENGFETAWIVYTDPDGAVSWHIFCHSEASNCVLIASSTKSFDEADQAVQDLQLVDTRIQMDQHRNDSYALRQSELGEGWETVFSISVASELMNATLEDPELNLNKLYKNVQLAKKSDDVYISVIIQRGKHAPVSAGETVIREMDCGGLPAVLLRSDGLPFLRLYNVEENYWIELHSFQTVPDEAVLIPLLEEVASKLEVVRIGVAEQAPFEFAPFSVG